MRDTIIQDVSSPENSSAQPETPLMLWNPTVTVYASLFFSTVFGSYLQMLNWQSLGEPQRAENSRRWFFASLAILVIDLIVALLMPLQYVNTYVALINIPVFLAWYFLAGRLQLNHVQDKLRDKYGRKPWNKVALYAGGGFVAYFALAVTMVSLNGFVLDFLKVPKPAPVAIQKPSPRPAVKPAAVYPVPGATAKPAVPVPAAAPKTAGAPVKETAVRPQAAAVYPVPAATARPAAPVPAAAPKTAGAPVKETAVRPQAAAATVTAATARPAAPVPAAAPKITGAPVKESMARPQAAAEVKAVTKKKQTAGKPKKKFQAQRKAPGARATTALARARINAGDYSGAVKILNTVIAGQPAASINYRLRGNAYNDLGKREMALADWEKAAALGDPVMQSWVNFLLTGGPQEEATAVEKTVQLPPPSPAASGRARIDAGDYRGAVETLSAAIAANPAESINYRLRGNAYNDLGNREMAVADWKKAAALGDPVMQSWLRYLKITW